MNKSDNDFDLPDYHADPLPAPRVVVQAEDLHLGPATVQPRRKSWVEEHGPQRPGPGLLVLDFLIVLLISIVFWTIIVSWQHVFS
jgi:hypothetical protein